MKVTIPITITKAILPVSLNVDGFWLTGYETESDPKVYTVRQDDEDVYIGSGEDGIYLNVFSIGDNAYGIKLGDNSVIPTSEVTDIEYEVETCALYITVKGIDQATSKLICDVSLTSDSGNGDFAARGVLMEDGVDTLIPLNKFYPA